MHAAAKAVDAGFVFPFYFADDVSTSEGDSGIPPDHWFWNADQPWAWECPQTFVDRVDDFLASATLADTALYFRPFFYPWGSAADFLRYCKHAMGAVLNELLPDNPPWMNWHTVMSGLRDRFPPGT